jgi:hypothetical protein
MAKKKRATPPRQIFTPEEIVEEWRERIVDKLGDWRLERAVLTVFVTKLEDNIRELMRTREFTREDMKNSKKVAEDMAKIFKLLQPDDKTITADTFEAVLELCATHHQTCSDAGGGEGGWCMV